MSHRTDDGTVPPPFYRDAVQMDPIFISHNVVESALASLNINKGAGSDGLHLRNLSVPMPFISVPLTYRKSLKVGFSI